MELHHAAKQNTSKKNSPVSNYTRLQPEEDLLNHSRLSFLDEKKVKKPAKSSSTQPQLPPQAPAASGKKALPGASKISNTSQPRSLPPGSEGPDPLLLNSRYGSCMVLGKSGTGKTTLLREAVSRHLARPEVKRLFVYNDRDRQYERAKSFSALSDLEHIPPNSLVVLEDIITLRPKEEEFVRQLLNFGCQHKDLHAFVVTHHLHKTRLFSTLPSFNYIVITSHRSNIPLAKIALGYFALSKSFSDRILNYMLSSADSASIGSFFVLDVQKMDFYYAPNFASLDSLANPGALRKVASSISDFLPDNSESQESGDPSQHQQPASLGSPLAASPFSSSSRSGPDYSKAGARRSGRDRTQTERLLEKFQYFSSSVDKPQEAHFLLKMILGCLPRELVREHDLTFSFQRRSGESDRVSIIDYVVALLDESSPPINKKLVFFHNYLAKHCCVPSVFRKNKNFSSTKSAKAKCGSSYYQF